MATLFASHVLRLEEWCVKVCFDHSHDNLETLRPFKMIRVQERQSASLWYKKVSSDGLGNIVTEERGPLFVPATQIAYTQNNQTETIN